MSFFESGAYRAAEFLVRQGANVNARKFRGWTPLHFAAQKGDKNVAEVLIEAGADLELKAWECMGNKDTNATALQIGIEKGHSGLVESLVDAGAIVEGKDLVEALKTPDILQNLLSSEYSLRDTEDGYGRTLLMNAAMGGYLESFRILLAAGAELDRKDPKENRTALMWAKIGVQTLTQCIIIEELLDAGAENDPFLPDDPDKCAEVILI